MKIYPYFFVLIVVAACTQPEEFKSSNVHFYNDDYVLSSKSETPPESEIDKSSKSINSLGNQVFSAIVNGREFNANEIRLIDVGPKYKIIIAKNHNIEGIRLNLWQIDKPGIYTLVNSPEIARNSYYIYDNFGIERQNLTWTISENNSLNTSEITISELSDTIIEGTFNFEAINLINKLDSKIIENGRFKIILP
ncbi:MAG: hypothetical protein GX163_02600 [Bacteroidetes bacterium]|nr:hypothetical protein [Bacteroidota bacterium]